MEKVTLSNFQYGFTAQTRSTNSHKTPTKRCPCNLSCHPKLQFNHKESVIQWINNQLDTQWSNNQSNYHRCTRPHNQSFKTNSKCSQSPCCTQASMLDKTKTGKCLNSSSKSKCKCHHQFKSSSKRLLLSLSRMRE